MGVIKVRLPKLLSVRIHLDSCKKVYYRSYLLNKEINKKKFRKRKRDIHMFFIDSERFMVGLLGRLCCGLGEKKKILSTILTLLRICMMKFGGYELIFYYHLLTSRINIESLPLCCGYIWAYSVHSGWGDGRILFINNI